MSTQKNNAAWDKFYEAMSERLIKIIQAMDVDQKFLKAVDSIMETKMSDNERWRQLKKAQTEIADTTRAEWLVGKVPELKKHIKDGKTIEEILTPLSNDESLPSKIMTAYKDVETDYTEASSKWENLILCVESSAAANKWEALISEKEKMEKVKDWEKPWISVDSLKTQKSWTGVPYKGINALMLMIIADKKHYQMPRWVTHRQLEKENYESIKWEPVLDSKGKPKKDPKTGKTKVRQVTNPKLDSDGNPLPKVLINKGEHGTPILHFEFLIRSKTDPHNRENLPTLEELGQMSKEDREKYDVFPKYTYYIIFNLEQTNLQTARPELWEKLCNEERVGEEIKLNPVDFSFEPIDKMIADNRWVCPIHLEMQDQAFFSPSYNTITLPLKEQFFNGETFYSTAFHEMGHSTGIPTLLNRPSGNGIKSPEYAKEELVAELTAVMVSSNYGITKHIKDDSVPYLNSWLRKLGESPDFIKEVLSDAKKASSMIISHIEQMRLEIEQGQHIALPVELEEELEIVPLPEVVEEDETRGFHR